LDNTVVGTVIVHGKFEIDGRPLPI